MLNKLMTVEGMVGKTIKNVYNSYDELILTFTDNTTLQFKASNGYDVTSLDVYDIEQYTMEDMFNAGLMTEKELKDYNEQQDALYARERERRDKEQYEALKKRFEGK